MVEAQNSVAVIEAGSFYEPDIKTLSHIPSSDVLYSSAAPVQASIQALVDWGLITQPQSVNQESRRTFTLGWCQPADSPNIKGAPQSDDTLYTGQMFRWRLH